MPPRTIDTATEASGWTLPLVAMMLCSGCVVSPSTTERE